MKKMKLFCTLALTMSVLSAIPAMANWNKGQGENSNRWWYGYGDGTYAKSGWFWLETVTGLQSAITLTMPAGF